jgi:hypothetical protein
MAQLFGQPLAETGERRTSAALVAPVEIGRVAPESAVQAVGAWAPPDVRRQIREIKPYRLISRKRVTHSSVNFATPIGHDTPVPASLCCHVTRRRQSAVR